ncbi:MAG TPA: hypothetical protein PKH77_27490 [Anaerolineae bacterium]|nr:hypothetical protein [Anaerolineae bacterium]
MFDLLSIALLGLLLYISASVIIISRHPSKRTKLALLVSPVLVFGLAIAVFFISFLIIRFALSREAQRFVHNFEQIPHPANSELVVSRADTGLLVGNSNHCDFFAGQIRWSMLTQQEIEDFYRGQTIPLARNRGLWDEDKTAVDIYTIFIEEEQITYPLVGGLPTSLETASDWDIDLADYPEGILYVVYAFDVGYEPGPWDLHCH